QIEDFPLHIARHDIAGMLPQRGHHLPGVKTRSPGIPDRERRYAIRMNVFRTFHQLGERRDGGAGILGQRRVDIEKDTAVALDDQRVCRRFIHGCASSTRGMSDDGLTVPAPEDTAASLTADPAVSCSTAVAGLARRRCGERGLLAVSPAWTRYPASFTARLNAGS